jgi:ribonucleotide reductase beta subunit family protein with ferritin-like domain
MLDWDNPLAISKNTANQPKSKPKQTKTDKQPAATLFNETTEAAAIPPLNTNIEPVRTEDKRVINGMTDVNQLAPFKYPWAWEFFLNANKNHWTPLDINMAQDVKDYHHKLTPEERHVYENVLAYLTTSDILAMRNIGLAVMEKMTAPELQIYQARQVYEEALHCYEEGTEVLTNKGFVDFRDIQADTLIAQYNKEGSIEFVSHLGITADDFEGELVTFKSSVYHSSVTPNHRCVSFNLHQDNALEITQAADLSPSNRDFPVAGKLLGNEDKTLTLLDKLRIAYQADGTIRNQGAITADGTIIYRWHLRKERKIERLLYLLDRLNLRHTHSGEYTEVWIPSEFSFGKDFSFVDLSNISLQWAEKFVQELTLWDGSQSANMMRYSSTNHECINIATAVGTLANYRVGSHIAQTSAAKDYYTLNFVDKNKVSGRSLIKSNKAYQGKVYSVGVPSTMIITRYDHKVCVSGNTWTYQHCIETIGLDQSEIYNRYRTVPAIHKKIQIANHRLNAVMRSDIDLKNRDNLETFVMSYMFFAGVFEGCWFYNGFSPIFALQRRGLMKGTAEQLQYIMRDEVMHASFGIRVVKQIIREENVTLDPKKIRDMWDEAEAAEMQYAQFLLKSPILGYSYEDHSEQFRFTANRRARQLGLDEVPFPGAENRLPWLEEQANMRKEKNFFETRVTEYQTGGALNWD